MFTDSVIEVPYSEQKPLSYKEAKYSVFQRGFRENLTWKRSFHLRTPWAAILWDEIISVLFFFLQNLISLTFNVTDSKQYILQYSLNNEKKLGSRSLS